jgi:hypothetical protein
MPFSFTTASFPIVKFMFSGKIRTDLEFDDITNLWEKQYDKEKPFTIIFDTRLMKIPDLKYAIKMVQFIGKLKKKKPQYLEKSYIIIRNHSIIRLLDFIFLIQPPVAPVFVTKNYIDVREGFDNLKIIRKYKPRKILRI